SDNSAAPQINQRRRDGDQIFDDASEPSTVRHAQVAVGVEEKLEVCSHFLKFNMPQVAVLPEHLNVAGTHGFEGDRRIEPRFAASYAHDLPQRLFVELVIQLVFVNEQEIRNESEIELSVAKRQPGQTARHVAISSVLAIIFEELAIGALAKTPEVFRRLVKVPAIRLQVAHRVNDVVQVQGTALRNFLRGQFVDRI